MQHIFNMGAVRIGDKDATCAAVDLGEVFAGRADGRGIDNRHHLFEMIVEQAIEKGFVGVLNIAQVDVFIVIVFEILELTPGALSLLFDTLDRFRQQAVEVKFVALFKREGAAFIQQGKFQQDRASVGDVQRTLTFVLMFHELMLRLRCCLAKLRRQSFFFCVAGARSYEISRRCTAFVNKRYCNC